MSTKRRIERERRDVRFEVERVEGCRRKGGLSSRSERKKVCRRTLKERKVKVGGQ